MSSGNEDGNVRDVSGVIEKLFVRLENCRLKCSPELNSHADELHAVYEDVSEVYISGKVEKLEKSKISWHLFKTVIIVLYFFRKA